jgi:hypothetical protein
MASGDTLLIFLPQNNEPPSVNYATLDTRNNHPVLDFGLSGTSVFSLVVPRNYGGNGITVYMHYAMSTAVANDIRLDTTFERIGDQQQNIGSDGFDATGVNGTDTTVPGTSGLVDIVNNVHSDGARLDSLAVGEGGRLKITRTEVAGTDASGDLELRFVELKET